MVKNSDLKLFKITFGDIESLTPLQKLDLIEWFFYGNQVKKHNSAGKKSIRSRVLNYLNGKVDLSLAVIANRLRYKLELSALENELESMVNSGELVKKKTKAGKDLYSIAKGVANDK